MFEEIEIAGNYGEQVIEVMGDAASKNAQAFEFGRLTKLFIESLPFGDVLHHNLNTQQRAVRRFDR